MSGAITHIERLAENSGIVRLVQLTDAHLCEAHGGTLLGMDTDQSLQLVIDLVKEERGQFDALLCTGDLSDHGSAAAYTRMIDYSRQLTDSSFWLPGNHDDRNAMSSALAGSSSMSSEVRIANWQILLLDSQVPGQVGGELGAQQLTLLEESLQRAAEGELNTLICLHHHPVEIGCAWLDEQIVADAGAFFDIVDSFDVVRGILWGHIHQEIDVQRAGARLMSSPSTCVQFAPGSELFKADNLAPGYRWLDLYADGSIDSGISRVEGVHFNVDLDSKGYV